MELKREERAPRFRPRLEGCVARDRHFASLLEGSYADTFASIAANIYRSLAVETCDGGLSELYEWIAVEELETFRTLGELIMALGGDAAGLRSRRMRPWAAQSDPCFLRACYAECERNVDRYETLMSRTGDRVVRSVMAKLLSSERRIMEKLMRAEQEKSC